MKPLRNSIEEARNTYEIYWKSYVIGDLKTFATTLDDTFEMIGNSETEVCHTKPEGIAFLKSQIAEIVGKVEMRNRQIDILPVDQFMLVHEQCDIYIKRNSDWNFYSKIRISTFRNGKTVEIAFTENGSCIPEDIKNKILQPFFILPEERAL